MSELKVVHVISGLSTGGAETMLFKLLSALQNSGPESEVIALAPHGEFEPRIRSLGVPVASPEMSSDLSALARVFRLSHMIRRARPDILHCWMYHANLLGGIAARMAGVRPILWGIRQSNLDPIHSKRMTRLVVKLGARLSRTIPDRIVCVSESVARVHIGLGYDARSIEVIPNGFDLEVFRPDLTARAMLRAELGLNPDAQLVGLVARLDPQKDHVTFMRAAAIVARCFGNAYFILAGTNTDGSNPELAKMIEESGLNGRVYGLGLRTDMARVTAALDVAVSSSAFGEGFSNAIGEALACAIPAVVTDVGDSAAIVGDAGRVVPAKAPNSLAAAVGAMLDLTSDARKQIGLKGRKRMQREYTLPAIAARYRSLYDDVLDQRGAVL